MNNFKYMNEAAEGGESTVSDSVEATESVSDEQRVAEAVNGTTEDNAWSLSESVKGEGEQPDWFKSDKYKTVSEQAKAYNELESRFGSFTGAPEEYAVELSEALKEQGVEIADDDPMLGEAMKFAKESGMDQKGFNDMVELYAITKLAEGEAIEQNKADEIKSLGANANQRLGNLNSWANANLSEDLVQGFQEMTTTAASVQALEHLIGLTRSAPLSPEGLNNAPSVSEEEVRSMQFAKDEFGNRKINSDPSFKADYEKKRDQLWGTGEHRVVIGQ